MTRPQLDRPAKSMSYYSISPPHEHVLYAHESRAVPGRTMETLVRSGSHRSDPVSIPLLLLLLLLSSVVFIYLSLSTYITRGVHAVVQTTNIMFHSLSNNRGKKKNIQHTHRERSDPISIPLFSTSLSATDCRPMPGTNCTCSDCCT